MSNLQQKITDLLAGPMRGQGWCSPEKGYELALAILKTKASVVVEVGVFYGASLLPMALACKEQGHGVVWAIDPWTRAAGTESYDGKNLEWWAGLDYENIYRTFLSHLKANDVERFVKVIRQRSSEVEPPKEIGLLHVDGNHGPQAISDVERFAPNVIPNGFCFCDDISWSSGAPAKAVGKLLEMGFVQIFERGTGAMFQRIGVHAKKRRKKRRKNRDEKPL